MAKQKSIEPDVVAWANQQLTDQNIKIAREQGTIDTRIDRALATEPSKRGRRWWPSRHSNDDK